MPITSNDVAWFAGILDGEGHICAHECGKPCRHQFKFQITNTDVGIIDECKRILMGWGIHYTTTLYQREGRKDCWVIAVQRKMEIKAMCPVLLLYLKSNEKRAQVLTILRVIEDTEIRRDGKRSNKRKSEANVSFI